MLVEPSGTTATVTGAIRQAARMTGASFQYLLAAARIESNFNPNAKVSTSSARGLFQFIEQTWFATLKEKGPALGYAPYANAIERLPSGRYAVADPNLRSAILGLRSDPAASALMAGAFTNDNASLLAAQLGRKPAEGELYIAHFLGPGGAGRLISLAETNPRMSAAAAFPAAAHANPTIFYNREGKPRSVNDVYQSLVGRYDVARARNTNTAVAALDIGVGQTANVALPPPRPASKDNSVVVAPMPPAVVAESKGASPSRAPLPADGAQRTAVAPIVSALWSIPGASAAPHRAITMNADMTDASSKAQSGGAATATAKVAVLDLFRDQPTNVSAIFRGQG